MKTLNPISPISGDPIKKKKVTAKGVNEGATDKGIKLSENEFGDAAANILFRKAETQADPINQGKYGQLDLFEEGNSVNGERVMRYRKGAARSYNNAAIKSNVMKEFAKRNPGQKITFDYAYGGEMEVNPINSIR